MAPPEQGGLGLGLGRTDLAQGRHEKPPPFLPVLLAEELVGRRLRRLHSIAPPPPLRPACLSLSLRGGGALLTPSPALAAAGGSHPGLVGPPAPLPLLPALSPGWAAAASVPGASAQARPPAPIPVPAGGGGGGTSLLPLAAEGGGDGGKPVSRAINQKGAERVARLGAALAGRHCRQVKVTVGVVCVLAPLRQRCLGYPSKIGGSFSWRTSSPFGVAFESC